MLNPLKDVLTVEMVRCLIAKIKGALATKVSMGDVVSSWQSTPDDAHVPTEKLVKDTLDNLPPGTAVKGDAESEYRTGNVNLTTANIGAATASQGAKADSAVQGVKVNGTELSKDSNNMVDVPVPTAFAATPLKDGTASAGSSSQWARGDHVHPTDDSREAVNNKKQVVNDSSTTEYPSSKAVADFVNSSVATNTANFLGTISESSLGLDYTATNEQIALALNVHSWESTPTNNDYCFVSVNDPQTTDVDEYRRFKFNGSVWAYEYTLNNSSFTQAQWDAINSGLTSSDRTAYNAAVTLLSAHVGDGSIHVTSSEKNAWNAKQDAISDLATIRSGASAGATALQPSGNGSNLSVTPDGTSTGYDLGSSTTLKVFAQKFKNLVSALKSLAFKDKVSDSDISGTISDSHIASASTWNGKQRKYLSVYGNTDKFVKLFRVYKFTAGSSIGTTVELIGRAGGSAVRVVINIKGSITADYIQFYDYAGDTSHYFTLYVAQDPDDSSKNLVYAFIAQYGSLYVNAADTSAGDTDLDFSVFGDGMSGRISGDTAITLRNMRDASWINSGTFDAARIPTSLPNVTAGAASAAASGSTLETAIDGKASITLNNVYGIRPYTLNISELTGNTWYNLFDLSIVTYTSIPVAIKIQGRNLGLFTLFIRWPHSESTTPTQFSIDSPNYTNVGYTVDPNNSRLFHIWLKTPGGLNTLSAVYESIGHGASPAIAVGTQTATSIEPTNLVRPSYSYPIVARGGKGSTTTPVYVDSNGQVQPCDPSQIGVGAASYAESVNLSRTLDSTYGDSIRVGTGTAVTISNSGNAKKWDSWRIAVDEFGTSSDTIYFY